MGLCWSTTLPEEDEDSNTPQSPKCLANSRTARKVVEFGREEVKLNELLASLRTGLIFAPTEFSVLPGGLSTSAKVTFEVGNSELQRRQEAAYLKEESLHNIMPSNESKEDDIVDEEEPISRDPQPFKLKVTLEGHGWAKKLVMTLCVQPVVGQFAGRTLQFHWRDDTLDVLGSEQGELEAHSLPLSFESEVEFCTCCLQLTYQNRKKLAHEEVDEDAEQDTIATGNVPSLKYNAYRMLVANLDTVADRLHIIPAKLYHVLFGSQDPVDISITLWPKSDGGTFTLKVKSGIIFAELVYLIQEHLHSKSNQVLKLYSNFRPIHTSEVVSEEFKHLDCFVIARDSVGALGGSCTSLEGGSHNASEELVLSLVGEKIQSMEADLDMPMKEFDTLIRSTFKLKDDSFLIILAQDDLAPQYMADDNWKCTYTFSIPDSSFGAGLRRSFRRLSTRRRGTEGRPRTPTSETTTSSTFAPEMAEVIELLSSNERRFPQNAESCGLSIEELYKSMPLYRMSIDQCGVHPHSIIQVFEVTGPSIPITVRVVSDYNNDDLTQRESKAPRTRLANIMDINPAWSISTFLQYIDAVVSLSSSSRQRRLWLKDNSMDYKTDLSHLTLGALLDSWKPLWWAEKGASRRQLTTKDIDPSEYLVVEKF